MHRSICAKRVCKVVTELVSFGLSRREMSLSDSGLFAFFHRLVGTYAHGRLEKTV